MKRSDPRWPDFDYSQLPDVGDLVEGREVVLVNSEDGEYITAPPGDFHNSPRATLHKLPRVK